MDEEIQTLKENEAFSRTTLPKDKKAVGVKWVYTVKKNADVSEQYKTCYAAKGCSQKKGEDYEKKFFPTANVASIRVLVQKAVQENLILHQMDVKTAYLHAPNEKLSLYGLKQ